MKWKNIVNKNQEKMNSVAIKFFNPERASIDNEPSFLVPYSYRQWIYFITAKQVNWLISVGGDLVAPMPHGKKFASGSFEKDGKNYGWEFVTIKGGAAQFKVTLVL